MSVFIDNSDSNESHVDVTKRSGRVTENSVFEGYSDSELESLVDPLAINRGFAPWIYWPAEIYSLGRLYREWCYYPKFLPLYVYSDHGIHRIAQLAPHEVNNDANVHFTFNPKRVHETSDEAKKEVICVPHPWVTYRRRNNIVPSKNAKGTLVFFSHSTEGTRVVGHDTDEYFKKLNNLPDKYHPIVLCMHMHDINKGHHKRLRKHELPIVTAGNASSVHFVDKFYDITRNFRYASSVSPGSQLYYCIEMGIPYFFLGDEPVLVNDSHPEMPLGVQEISDPIQAELTEIERYLFSQQLDHASLHQKIFVEWMLGLNSKVTRLDASWILWREFFRNWYNWPLIFKSVLEALQKHGPVVFLKKFRTHFKKEKF